MTLSTIPQHWPAQALDVAAELRRQLDAAETTIAELRAALESEADDAEMTYEGRASERKSARFWFSAWSNSTRRLAQLQVRIAKLEGWLIDSGHEATRLQTELDRTREQNAGLARQLAETERDYTEMYADREELAGKLVQCGCHGERVH